MEKTKILMVHGGITFKSQEDYKNYLRNKEVRLEPKKRWQDSYLTENLGQDFQIIRPRMPLQDNAEYEDWKIIFENYINALDGNIILIGSSLGGVFLAKYLSENKIDKKIISAYLIASPFDNSLIGEDLVGGFELGEDLSLIEKNCKKVVLMFSKDDDCVPLAHADNYRKKLKGSNFIIYESKNGHFQIEEFPEIVDMIKKSIKEVL